MIWSLGRFLKEGELVNTVEDRVTGWLRFAGMRGKVTVKLEGSFHRDIRASRIHLVGWGRYKNREGAQYMAGFKTTQTGTVECITAGLPPYEASVYPCIEWCSRENGRVRLELEPSQIEVMGEDWWTEVDAAERPGQLRNMTTFVRQIARQVRKREYAALGRRPAASEGQRWRAEWSVLPGLQLLPPKLRDLLPELRSRKKLTAGSVACVRYFTPDSHRAWWAAGFDGKDTFFGIVQGSGAYLGEFSLSGLKKQRGPLGMPVLRDIHWSEKTLEWIAPELFTRKRHRKE